MVQKRDIFLMRLAAFLSPPRFARVFFSPFPFIASGYSSSGEIRADWSSLTLCSFDRAHTETDLAVSSFCSRLYLQYENNHNNKKQRWRPPVTDSCCSLLFLFVWERTLWQSAHPEFDSLKKRSTLRLSAAVWSHQSVMFGLMAKCFSLRQFFFSDCWEEKCPYYLYLTREEE